MLEEIYIISRMLQALREALASTLVRVGYMLGYVSRCSLCNILSCFLASVFFVCKLERIYAGTSLHLMNKNDNNNLLCVPKAIDLATLCKVDASAPTVSPTGARAALCSLVSSDKAA